MPSRFKRRESSVPGPLVGIGAGEDALMALPAIEASASPKNTGHPAAHGSPQNTHKPSPFDMQLRKRQPHVHSDGF
jgi:hypothetical protein